MVNDIYKLTDKKELFSALENGLRNSPQNHELYYLLGNYYRETNLRQALLCYEQAEYYCQNEKDKCIISKAKQQLEAEGIAVPNVSIIILTYQSLAEIKACLDSVEDSMPGKRYEIIIVDNGSADGTETYLKEKRDIKLISNKENIGYPAGYNQAIKLAEAENDILLLHNDTIVMPNSIFWLRMGLYEEDSVGGTGGVSNFAQNYQQINEAYSSPDEYLKYGMTHNIPMEYPYERKLRLMGFALMLKRRALNKIGMYDEQFSPGGCEDDDLSYRMIAADYQLLMCRNSFVYHFGTESLLKGIPDPEQTQAINAAKFKHKWGFDYRYYTYERRNLIEIMGEIPQPDVKILEIGCGMGATLGYLKNKYPDALVYGVELEEEVALMAGKYLPGIISGNIEQMELPYPEGFFDYIIFADVLEHLHNPEQILHNVGRYLNPSGSVLASIPNMMHYSVILELLRGNFTYRESGILDRTHLHFFTLNEIMAMFGRCGYEIETITGSSQNTKMGEETAALYEALLKLPGIAPEYNFQTYQYLVKANKIGQKSVGKGDCS